MNRTDLSLKSAAILLPALGLLASVAIPPVARAETVTTKTTVTTTSTDEIASQEKALQEKMREYEKTDLELKQAEALRLRKGQLEVEIKTLEIQKARRELQVQETKDELEMLLEGDVLFDTNSAVIKTGAHPRLRQVALILAEYPRGRVMVTGFADSTGKAQANMELSRKRGEAVKTYLLDKSPGAISSERIVAEGRGEASPVATNQDAAGRQLNRRVEITVSKSL